MAPEQLPLLTAVGGSWDCPPERDVRRNGLLPLPDTLDCEPRRRNPKRCTVAAERCTVAAERRISAAAADRCSSAAASSSSLWCALAAAMAARRVARILGSPYPS